MDSLLLRLGHHDQRMLLALVTRRRQWLDNVMRLITHLGGATMTVSLTLALLLAGDTAMLRAGLRGGFALLASHLLVQLLKRAIHRPRPNLETGYGWLVRAPDRFSFPSGHSAAALAVGIAFATLLSPTLGATVITLALGIGVSRAYLGVHYPGDVLAGWCLALATWCLADPVIRSLGF